jgi:hypothetical protein
MGFERGRWLVGWGLCACLSLAACRIRSTGPRWIQTHGDAAVTRIAGGPLGLFAIGTNGRIYNYPEPGSIWHEWSSQMSPRVLAGSRHGLVYADAEGHVGKGNHGHAGSAEWTLGAPVTALATDADGSELYAVADGHVSRLVRGAQEPGPCGQLKVVSIALALEQIWLSDGQRLYLGSADGCQPAPGAPSKITRMSGLGPRLFALNESGDVFRLQQGRAWEQLPRPQKFRRDQFPALHPVRDVAVTSTAAWAVDDESNVFVFSESE